MTEETRVVSRRVESPVVSNFLARAFEQPCALLVEGEAGIGKTTFWLAVLELAVALGFRVLSARPAAAETVLAYASLSDLLSGVDPASWAELPEPQRLAIDRVTLRATALDGLATDQRAVAAGFVSVVEELAADNPVLLAIDDLQWLDPSSAAVIGFAARRLSGPVGVLGAVRLAPDSDGASWLRLPRPDAEQRIRLPPMGLGELHHVISERLGHSFSRPVLVRIHEISGGNPFYAIELGRAIATETIRADTPLPGTLAELVRARIGALGADVQDVLLAAACNAAPTLELVGKAIDVVPQRLIALVDKAEDTGIVVLDGHRVRFAHPLLAHGVYTRASPSRRREMHRRMAAIIDEPEVRARHLALATVTGDLATLEALDTAAEMARVRGAPADAAELIELAINLGGDTPERRILLAGCRFNSGDGASARVELEAVAASDAADVLRAEALNLLGMMSQLEGTLRDAANELDRALAAAGENLDLRARILTSLSWVQIHLGQLSESARSIEDAVMAAEHLARAQPLSEALGMHVVLQLMLGNGLDSRILNRALELEAGTTAISVMFRPSVQNAMVLAWTGQVEAAHAEYVAIRQNCIERGEESELAFVCFHFVQNNVWRADFSSAALIADDTVERARQLDGVLPLAAALSVRALVAAYAGRENDARLDAHEAIGPISRFGSDILKLWSLAPLGFLEVSLGNYQAAIEALNPLLDRIIALPNATEIYVAPFLPDAIEALIQLSRLDEAEQFVDLLERNGRRLDRPWMLAVGARGRGMLLAAQGDLDAAFAAVRRAMVEHERVAMPFERARSLLLLGQIQRRQRQKDIAASTLAAALAAFEALGTPLWADRTRGELQRVKVGHQQAGALTASEHRVAELAASGMTNREIASALFISPKTVETNIGRVYRKLGIHRRAELGHHFGRGPDHG
jgi:DNA-binding CsgD family transcriptional regulator